MWDSYFAPFINKKPQGISSSVDGGNKFLSRDRFCDFIVVVIVEDKNSHEIIFKVLCYFLRRCSWQPMTSEVVCSSLGPRESLQTLEVWIKLKVYVSSWNKTEPIYRQQKYICHGAKKLNWSSGADGGIFMADLINTMAADALVIYGAMASPAMVLPLYEKRKWRKKTATRTISGLRNDRKYKFIWCI